MTAANIPGPGAGFLPHLTVPAPSSGTQAGSSQGQAKTVKIPVYLVIDENLYNSTPDMFHPNGDKSTIQMYPDYVENAYDSANDVYTFEMVAAEEEETDSSMLVSRIDALQ